MRRGIFLALWMTFFGAIVLASSPAAAQDALPKAGDLKAGQWNEISPGDSAVCAYGDAYHFYVHPSVQPTDKLMIYFAGGGACWNASTCSPKSKGVEGVPIFTSAIAPDETASLNKGLFDFTNPENPVADYNIVYLPYCTGDIHTGDKIQHFTAPDGTAYTMNFMGYVNATAALNWVFANYTQPSQVFVPGCSAGAYGSIYNAPRIMAHYSGVRVVQLGDAGVGITPDGWTGSSVWGFYDHIPDAMKDKASTDLHFTDLYEAAARAFPTNAFAEYTSTSDRLQIFFYDLLVGTNTDFVRVAEDWVNGMQATLKTLETDLPNFRGYQAWGSDHCVINTSAFYILQVNGLRVRDWVADLLNAQPVANVTCKDCTTPELYTPK